MLKELRIGPVSLTQVKLGDVLLHETSHSQKGDCMILFT